MEPRYRHPPAPPPGADTAAQGAGRGGGQGRGGGGGGGRGGGGAPPVEPGRYTAILGKVVGETFTAIGVPQSFRVVPLPEKNYQLYR